MAKVRNLQVGGYGNFQGPGRYDIRRYGAKGDGVTDDTAAIQAAFNAASSNGGGWVCCPPGTFRFSGGITVPNSVSVCGIPNKTFFLNSSTATTGFIFLTYNDSPLIFQDIRFIGEVPYTGSCVRTSVSSHVQFIRCAWNGYGPGGGLTDNLQGRILYANTDGSQTDFIDCDIRVGGDANGVHVLNGASASIVRGTLTMPTTFSSALARAEGASTLTMRDVNVDCTARTAGGGAAVMLLDTTSIADVTGCTTNAQGTVGTLYGVLWSAGARVTTRGNRWLGNVTVYGNNRAITGSSVELIDYLPFYPGSVTAYTIPTGVRTVVLAFNGNAPTITMPPILFGGQLLNVTVWNDSTSINWANFFITGMGYTVSTIGINAKRGRSFQAMAVDFNENGTMEWAIVGEFSQPFSSIE